MINVQICPNTRTLLSGRKGIFHKVEKEKDAHLFRCAFPGGTLGFLYSEDMIYWSLPLFSCRFSCALIDLRKTKVKISLQKQMVLACPPVVSLT